MSSILMFTRRKPAGFTFTDLSRFPSSRRLVIFPPEINCRYVTSVDMVRLNTILPFIWHQNGEQSSKVVNVS